MTWGHVADKLFTVGGRQGTRSMLPAHNRQWVKYDRGLIYLVDPESGVARSCIEHATPPELHEADPAILFKCSIIENDRLYTCTETEVLVYSLPDFVRVAYISLPAFHDLHHVRPTPDGTLLVCNAGLDMMQEMTLTGQILREWSVLREDPWARHSRAIDYRKQVMAAGPPPEMKRGRAAGTLEAATAAARPG